MFSTSDGAEDQYTIEIKDPMDLMFSPQGTYLCIWCKPVLLDKESGKWNNNVALYNVVEKQLVTEWSNKNQAGWKPQFTSEEKIMAKNSVNSKQIDFYELVSGKPLVLNQPSFKYKVQDGSANYQTFQISPGRNPSIAIFIPEKSGKPASVLIYNIPNFQQPICSKSFFKAERCQLKWNSLGTALLALASTDHDTTNKSYYGETNLYLLGIAGSYDSRINLDKEGPIHDITWSPSSREFAVSYGYMPASTTFFDARGNAIHQFPDAPRNTILYSPHARFVLVAGFGNLQGTVDVYDRQNKFGKVCTFEASNTSVCSWSPCGRYIMTATTSPRLRVDNGLKIWHASGKLIYVTEYPELLDAVWKPQSIDQFPALKSLDAAIDPLPLAVAFLSGKSTSQVSDSTVKKPLGAYRPPHARRSGGPAVVGTTSLAQRELSQSGSSNANNAAATSNGGAYVPGATRRVVPGAPVPVAQESKSAAKNRKKRAAKKAAHDEGGSPSPAPAPTSASQSKDDAGSVVGGVISYEEKRIRSLLKKLRAIETLKLKQTNGEPLEDTQVSKIHKEDEIRLELLLLGWNGETSA